MDWDAGHDGWMIYGRANRQLPGDAMRLDAVTFAMRRARPFPSSSTATTPTGSLDYAHDAVK
jgi:hypothetical protein